MKSVLQIAFLVLVGAAYLFAFLLFWIGLFPQDEFPALLTRWSVVAPFLAVALPFMAFVAFVLGYDPRTRWLTRFRHYLLLCLQTTRALCISIAVLVAINAIEGALIVRSFAQPPTESLKRLLVGDFDNAVKLAKIDELAQKGASVVRLVAESEIEAKRRLSTSDSPTEIVALQSELTLLDRPFAPLWHRFLTQRGLGRLAFARKDIDGMAFHFIRAKGIARWIDTFQVGAVTQAHAAGLFSLAQAENDTAKARELLEKAEKIAQPDMSIPAQRLLGSIYFTKGDYGGAYRAWKALLDRGPTEKDRGMEIPDAIERKRLSNNIALARLRQAQPKYALEIVETAIKESWNKEDESHRTEQVRLLATKTICLLALGRPDDALNVFEERRKLSVQLTDEGLTPGSYLLKANILSARWRTMKTNDHMRRQIAEDVLHALLRAQEPKRDLRAFKDYGSESFSGLINDVATLWRWDGISFDRDGCNEVIQSLLL